MIDNCKKEIISLHRFFEQWFKGNVPDDEKTFSRISGVLDEKFLMISPSGKITDKPALIAGLKLSHNRWETGDIQIKNMKGRVLSGDFTLMIYEEWQHSPQEITSRLSSALFKKDEKALHGVRWLHLHEVWIR